MKDNFTKIITDKQTQPPHNIGKLQFVTFCGFSRRENPQKMTQKVTKVHKNVTFVTLSQARIVDLFDFLRFLRKINSVEKKLQHCKKWKKH